MNVGVNGKGRLMKRLHEDDRGRFMADAGELFKCFEIAGHLALVMLEKIVGELPDGARFGSGKTAGTDDLSDFFDGELDHLLGRVGFCKEERCDEVDAGVGALGGEQDGNQEGVGIFVLKGDCGIGEELLEEGGDGCSSFFLLHFPRQNLEKIAERISSVTFVPMIVPNS